VGKTATLRARFVTQILITMFIIAVITGGVQIWLMDKKIEEDIESQAVMISESIQQGIKETDLAAGEIEHQIDLKLEAYAKRIADKLRGKPIDQITNEELLHIRDEIGVSGITLFVRTEDDIVGARATDPKEIGFGIRKINPYGFQVLDDFMQGKKLSEEIQKQLSYYNEHMQILFITQSTSDAEEPRFYKYGYYREEGLDYLINPYIEAGEIFRFTNKVGPDSWIQQVLEHNRNALEIAVLDPNVFADPSLIGKHSYPPLKKVVNGEYTLEDQRDAEILADMIRDPRRISYLQAHNGKKIYKMFLPIREDRVLYIALDYGKMVWPYYRVAVTIVISSFISLAVLFVLTARFFNRIYLNIQKIIKQIHSLESGDFTAKSEVRDKGELGRLSESTNKMADALNRLLSDTYDKATKVQKLSVLLENEANESVDKAFSLSMETTSTARASLEEIYYFLDLVEEQLQLQDHPKAREALDKLDMMRELARERTNNATEMTIMLSDLFKSLHAQSSELSDLSDSLLRQLGKFKLTGMPS